MDDCFINHVSVSVLELSLIVPLTVVFKLLTNREQLVQHETGGSLILVKAVSVCVCSKSEKWPLMFSFSTSPLADDKLQEQPTV